MGVGNALGILAARTRAQERYADDESGSAEPSGRFFIASMLALAGGFALIIAPTRA